MVTGGILQTNPAAEVKGPKHRVKISKTPVLTDEEMRQLLDSIDMSHVVGLRDRALIATMFFSFARIGAVLGMKVSEYFPKGKRYWLRLHEKGGKYHEVPAHHAIEAYLDLYIREGELQEQKDTLLFRTTVGRTRKLTERGLQRQEAWAMIKRQAIAAGVNTDACNHTFKVLSEVEPPVYVLFCPWRYPDGYSCQMLRPNQVTKSILVDYRNLPDYLKSRLEYWLRKS